ncbi:hypothetical protein TB2_030991 [Malus domestica]
MQESGCQLDDVVYTCLIAGFGNQKKMETIYELLKEMKENGCTHDGRTYNALIKVMIRQQRMPNDAMQIYKKMIQNGIEPSIYTYNMIMKSYFHTRNYDVGKSGEACKFLEGMVKKGMKPPQLGLNNKRKMKFDGKFEVSNVFARWVEMMKKRVKRRDHSTLKMVK